MNAPAIPQFLPVVWSNEKVITTELLAKLYGTSMVNIRKNHSNNIDRFEEGKHFHKIIGDDLETLRVNLSHLQISPKARSLILWTERGAARHAKMLETNAAWDVFEALEDSYFRSPVVSAAPKPRKADKELSTVGDREPLLHSAIKMVVRHRLPFNKVYQTMNYYANSAKFQVMTKAQVAEAEQFIERLLLGQDTRADWLRIGANKRELTGDDAQPELLGFVVPGVLGGK